MNFHFLAEAAVQVNRRQRQPPPSNPRTTQVSESILFVISNPRFLFFFFLFFLFLLLFLFLFLFLFPSNLIIIDDYSAPANVMKRNRNDPPVEFPRHSITHKQS